MQHLRNPRILIILAALLLGGCGFGGPAYAPVKRAGATVSMGLMSYSPATIVIHPDETVTWKNLSIITHTVTDNPALAQKRRDSTLPSGAAPFNSGDIRAGQVYSHTFHAAGTYRYFCKYHEDDGMIGTVIVKPRSTKTKVSAASYPSCASGDQLVWCVR
jgi:plastocyanin